MRLIRRLLLPVLLLLVGDALRVHRLADHNIWWDEGFSVYLARLPLVQMAVRTAADVHPPIHYAFLHYWDRLVGESEYALRYSTALFGVLDLALVYWLVRRYVGVGTALVALALLAASRLHVEWSQQLRMYTLATALVLGSTACFLRLTVDGDRRARWWLGHGALSVVGLHTIYIFGMAPLFQTLAVGVGALFPVCGRRLERGFITRWVAVQAAAVGLFVPWVVLYLRQPRPEPRLLYPIDLLTWLRAVFTALPIGVSAYVERWTPVLIGATLLALLPLLLERRRPWLWLAAYPPLALAPFLVYGLSFPNPVLYAPNLSVRYLMLFLPIYCLLLARGLVLVWRRFPPMAALAGAGLLAASGVTLTDLYGSQHRRDEYRSIASFIRAYEEPSDAVVLYSDYDWPVFLYYFAVPLERYGVGTLTKQTPESAAKLGTEMLGAHPSLWLVTLDDAYDADPEHFLRSWLESHARTAADFHVANKRLTFFTTDPARTTARPSRIGPTRPLDVPPLVGVDVPARELAAGERLHLATYWRTPLDTVPRLELVDEAGAVWRAVRTPLPANLPASALARADTDLPFPDRLPPGPYDVRLTSPVSATLARLTVLPPENPPAPRASPPQLPPRDDRFGGLIALAGAQVDGATVRLLWRALQAMDRPYTVFVQVVGDQTNPATGNPVWAQLDAPPGQAGPTTDWLPGDLVADTRVLQVPPTLPKGSYRLIVGLYDPADGRRLTLPDGADHVELASWSVP